MTLERAPRVLNKRRPLGAGHRQRWPTEQARYLSASQALHRLFTVRATDRGGTASKGLDSLAVLGPRGPGARAQAHHCAGCYGVAPGALAFFFE